MYTFVSKKTFGQLLDASHKHFILKKAFDSESSYIEVWFADKNSKPLVTEDKISIILVINWNGKYKKRRVIQFNKEIVKGYVFLSLVKYISKNIDKNISKDLRYKYSQKLLDHAKKSATDELETISKRVIQKSSEATGNLIGNKTANRTKKVSKIHNKIIQRQLQMKMIKKYLKKYIYHQKKGSKLLMV